MPESNAPVAAETGMTLRIVTPRGTVCSTACDSVTLPLMDDSNGVGGGSIGVRHGHIRTMMALAAGDIRALTNGAQTDRVSVSGGFAMVQENVVTVITDSAQTQSAETKSEDAEE